MRTERFKPRTTFPKQSRENQATLQNCQTILSDFTNGQASQKILQPMNSYVRRVIHQVAKEYQILSSSHGEEDQRHVVLKRTPKTSVPKQLKALNNPVWNFSHREFLVRKSQIGSTMVLLKNGSVELLAKQPAELILDQQLITTGSFKVIKNQLVQFTDPLWVGLSPTQ